MNEFVVVLLDEWDVEKPHFFSTDALFAATNHPGRLRNLAVGSRSCAYRLQVSRALRERSKSRTSTRSERGTHRGGRRLLLPRVRRFRRPKWLTTASSRTQRTALRRWRYISVGTGSLSTETAPPSSLPTPRTWSFEFTPGSKGSMAAPQRSPTTSKPHENVNMTAAAGNAYSSTDTISSPRLSISTRALTVRPSSTPTAASRSEGPSLPLQRGLDQFLPAKPVCNPWAGAKTVAPAPGTRVGFARETAHRKVYVRSKAHEPVNLVRACDHPGARETCR